MQYLGGKYLIRDWIATVVAGYLPAGGWIWEPFCGSLGSAVAHNAPVLCSDVRASLHARYQAVAGGWDPPEHVSEYTQPPGSVLVAERQRTCALARTAATARTERIFLVQP